MVEARHNELVNPSQPHRQGLTKAGEEVMGMTGLTNQSRPEVGKLTDFLFPVTAILNRSNVRGAGDEARTLQMVPHRLEIC